MNHNCPIDLSGDEAQYWDWSRNLDLSYYSKGPLVAYIIRASCEMFGNTMPAVRYPALFFSVATSLVTYLLTKKLFDSEKLALGTVLLISHRADVHRRQRVDDDRSADVFLLGAGNLFRGHRDL